MSLREREMSELRKTILKNSIPKMDDDSDKLKERIKELEQQLRSSQTVQEKKIQPEKIVIESKVKFP